MLGIAIAAGLIPGCEPPDVPKPGAPQRPNPVNIFAPNQDADHMDAYVSHRGEDFGADEAAAAPRNPRAGPKPLPIVEPPQDEAEAGIPGLTQDEIAEATAIIRKMWPESRRRAWTPPSVRNPIFPSLPQSWDGEPNIPQD